MKWIKLYTEILDDPKIQRLPKSARWTATSCFLVAGEMERDGYIGRLDDLAWRLRENEEEMSRDIDALVQVGIIEWEDDELYVVKYAERQGVTTSRERTRRYREKQREDGDDDVTSQERHSDALEKRREEEIREEEKREEGASPFSESVSFDASVQVDTTAPEIDHRHAVLAVWQEVLHRYPPKTRWHEIVNVVGVETQALRRLLTVWKSKKWNPTDVDGILERYRMARASEIDALVEQEKKLTEAITIDQMLRRAQNGHHRSKSH